LAYKNYVLEPARMLRIAMQAGKTTTKTTQDELKKKIERIKLKTRGRWVWAVERSLLKEFKEVSERDEFLAKEMGRFGEEY